MNTALCLDNGCLLWNHGNFGMGGEHIKHLGDITKINGSEVEPFPIRVTEYHFGMAE